MIEAPEEKKAEAVEERVRDGPTTSEFRFSVLAAGVGFAMIVLSLLMEDRALQEHGVEVVKWSVLGYTASRGLAKLRR